MALIDHKIIIAYQTEIIACTDLSDAKKLEIISKANAAAISLNKPSDNTSDKEES